MFLTTLRSLIVPQTRGLRHHYGRQTFPSDKVQQEKLQLYPVE